MRMRTIEGNTGAVFDVREQDEEEFEAAFENARETGNRLNFSIEVCKSLPDLYDDSDRNRARGGGYQQRN